MEISKLKIVKLNHDQQNVQDSGDVTESEKEPPRNQRQRNQQQFANLSFRNGGDGTYVLGKSKQLNCNIYRQ